jgi:hypothetical protein
VTVGAQSPANESPVVPTQHFEGSHFAEPWLIVRTRSYPKFVRDAQLVEAA